MDVGVRLQGIRKLKGLSQRELAKRAGVTNSTISMIEKNSVSPSISSLKKVLSGIPMSLVEFFSLDMDEENTTQVVYKADELLSMSSGEVAFKLVGKAHPNRALAFLDETYPPGADTGEDMYSHDGEEAGMLIEGRPGADRGQRSVSSGAGRQLLLRQWQAAPLPQPGPADKPARLISATTPANF